MEWRVAVCVYCACTASTHITNARIISAVTSNENPVTLMCVFAVRAYTRIATHHHYAATLMTMYRNVLMSIKAFLSMFTACHKISLPITHTWHSRSHSKQCLIHWNVHVYGCRWFAVFNIHSTEEFNPVDMLIVSRQFDHKFKKKSVSKFQRVCRV